MLGGHWDGVIVGFDDPHGPELLRMAVPLVGVGGGYGWFRPDTNIPYVGTDNTAVAQLAADHLLERGFVHFAYCGYSPTPVNRLLAQAGRGLPRGDRAGGYACATYNASNTASDTWERLCGDSGQWLTSLPRPVGHHGLQRLPGTPDPGSLPHGGAARAGRRGRGGRRQRGGDLPVHRSAADQRRPGLATVRL